MNRKRLAAAAAVALGGLGGLLYGIVPSPYVPGSGAPTNQTLPTITGTTQTGQTLTVNQGTWTNTPTSYTHQWQRCSPACSNVGGATGTTYLLSGSDLADTIDVIETATNGSGSASATSAQTATITNPSASIGTGASKANCSPSPCQAILTTNGGWNFGSQTVTGTAPTANITGTPFTFDDGTHYDNPSLPAHNITSYMWIGIPPNLVTNDATHPVPLVITFPDGCTGTSYTNNQKNTGCLDTCNSNACAGGISDNGTQGWSQVCATAKCVVVSLFAWAGGGFQTPTQTTTSVLNACGSSGTAPCDQVAEVAAAISYMQAHYAIDPNMIFANGASKGNTQIDAAMCDSRTEPSFAGLSGGSFVGIINNGSAVTNVPRNNFFGNQTCANLVSPPGPLPSPVANVHRLMYQGWWSASDVQGTCTSVETWDGISNASCMNGGMGGSGNWQDSYPDKAQYIVGPAFVCTGSPTVGNVGTNIVARTYTSCAGNSANLVAVQTVDYPTPSCHAWACDGKQGGDTYIAQMAWNFWTTGTTTP